MWTRRRSQVRLPRSIQTCPRFRCEQQFPATKEPPGLFFLKAIGAIVPTSGNGGPTTQYLGLLRFKRFPMAVYSKTTCVLKLPHT
jgi:hypothetical protein